MNSSLSGAGASMIGIAVYNTLDLWLASSPWTYTKGMIVGTVGLIFCILSALV